MIGWAQLAILLLQVVKAIMGERDASRSYKAGEEAQINKELMELLQRTETGKKLYADIQAMSDDNIDDYIDVLAGVPSKRREG